MIVGNRLREIRILKNLSQGEIERRTGLLRCYTSRVENGHTVPSVKTLQKYALALEVPMYQLFHGGEEPILVKQILSDKHGSEHELRAEDRLLRSFARALAKMDDRNRKLFFAVAGAFANRRTAKGS